ncbi:MAG: hypothetical protein IPN76_23020 [Saprospiraceae bacterium]|nr:hypothetical protein [Saprospiraceae bacterium]
MTKFFLMLLLAAPTFFGFTAANESDLTCPLTTGVFTANKSGGDISFDWNNCSGGCVQYLVKYIRRQDNYQSQEFTTGTSAYSFSNLPSGNYDFYFATDCGGGSTSGWIIIEELIIN